MPFIEVHGEQYVGGTDNLIEQLDDVLGLSNAVLDLSENENLQKEEKALRKQIDQDLNRWKFKKYFWILIKLI